MTVAKAPTGALQLQAPSVKRRLAAFTYEGILLFGIVMTGAYLYDTLTQHRHALQGRTGLQIFLFLLIGAYFVWFWSHGGQTVATKTWHIRVVNHRGEPIGMVLATFRYLLSWVWFLPALVIAYSVRPISSTAIFGLMTLGWLVYGGLALLHPQRQFVHDVLCGTRLIDVRPAKTPKQVA